LKHSDVEQERLKFLFTLLASRPANPVEQEACLQLLKTMKTRYAKSPEDAIALLSIGDAGRDESLNVGELAAWAQVAATVLASDLAILLY